MSLLPSAIGLAVPAICHWVLIHPLLSLAAGLWKDIAYRKRKKKTWCSSLGLELICPNTWIHLSSETLKGLFILELSELPVLWFSLPDQEVTVKAIAFSSHFIKSLSWLDLREAPQLLEQANSEVSSFCPFGLPFPKTSRCLLVLFSGTLSLSPV